MAYDEHLALRIRGRLANRDDVEEKRMFGGLCFMISGHMCCGIVDDMLMARVGPDNYDECLRQDHAREMDFTGRAMRGMVYVTADGIVSDAELGRWLGVCAGFVESLPPKAAK